MYFVKLDNQTFYDPRIEEYKIFNPKLKLEVNKAGAFDFTVYPSHPLFARIFKLKSIVEVYQDSTLLFRGRVLDDELAFDKAKKVYCEGELAYFNDTVLRPYEHTGSVRGYLELIVNQHNSQVPTAKQFTVGNVTVTDPNDLIVRSDATYPQTWNVVESKLINSLGGYLVIRRVGNVNYLDYLKDSNYMSLQEIKLGKNLLDLATKSSATELYTAILPIGKELEDANGQGTGEYLTIKSVNGGVDYVKDDEAIEKYGFIMKKVEWRDVTIASNLLTKARQELAQSIKLSLSLNLTAIDLSMTDSTIDEFRVFEYVNVVSNPHGIEERLLIEKQELNLTNPSQDKLTIGVQRKSLTETQIQTEKAISNIVTIKGPKGQDGQTPYFHTAWANNETGTSGFSTTDSVNKLYIGTYTDYVSADSTDPSKYSWTKIKGDKGATGAQGASATSYWITASNNIIAKSQTGVINPTTITFTGYSKTGTANSALYAGHFIIQTSTNGTSYTTRYTSSANQNAYTYTIPADTKFIKALFYQAGGTSVLLDEQTVPVVESAEGIQFGGRNSLTSTVTLDDMNDSQKTNGVRLEEDRHMGNLSIKRTFVSGHADTYHQQTSVPMTGKEYVVTFWAKADRPLTFWNYLYNPNTITSSANSDGYKSTTGDGSSALQATTEWKKYWIKWTQNSSPSKKYLLLGRIQTTGTIWINSPMLVEGNVPVDWQPAPEDIQSELDDKASNDYVTSVETTLNTTIEESAGEIRREMSESYTSKSEFGTYKETVSSQFDQTAKGFGLTFKNLIEQIETLDGETKATFDEIVKYIRFVDGNIILGKVGNELELKIRHDRIQFIQSGVEVAYFSNNKLYVTDGEFINSLKLGNFAFIPRENGSLDFRKVVN